jgi:hypothetical protein
MNIIQDMVTGKFIGLVREFGFTALAEGLSNGSMTDLGPREAAVVVASTVLSVMPEYLHDYDRGMAVLALSQVIESPTDEQVEKFLDTYKLLKQIVDAKVSLRAAEFNLQCAIDNGDVWWENGCRNEIFKQEYVMNKTLVELHA